MNLHEKVNSVKSNKPPVNVLLVDDDEDDCFLFEEAIKELSFPVELKILHNSYQLFQFLAKEKIPDIVFLDLSLPGKSGTEILKELRALQKFIHLPVITYTGSTNPDEIENVIRLGANLNIIKPIVFLELVETLSRVLTIDWKKKQETVDSEKRESNITLENAEKFP